MNRNRSHNRMTGKQLFRRGLSVLAVLLMTGAIAASAVVFVPERARAYDEITQLEVTVGYFDGKEYQKANPTISEIEEDLTLHRAIYTSLNSGPSPSTIEVEGVYVSDLMEYCGVDMSSVDGYNFFTQDAGYHAITKSWTYQELFGRRYTFQDVFFRALEDYESSDPEDYMRNPENHYTINNFFDSATGSYKNEAWAVREEVAPMLALYKRRCNWRSYTPASRLDFSGMDTSNTPVLYYGQKTVSEQTSADMAQMIWKINIRYEGSPEITVDNAPVEGEAGTEGSVTVHVSTPDATLTEAILSELEYESSDTSVATVDRSGRVVIQGEGAASISVSYNGRTYGSIGATGKKGADEIKPEEDEEDQDPGSGDGDGSGDGSGSGGGKGDGNGSGNSGKNGKGSKSSGKGSSKDKGSKGTDSSGQSGVQTGGTSSGKSTGITTNTNTRVARSVVPKGGLAGGQTEKISPRAPETSGKKGASGEGKNDKTIESTDKIYEITPQDAQQLTEGKKVSKEARRGALAAGFLAVAVGAAAEGWNYKKQAYWVKQAKKVYEKNESKK